MLPLDVDALEPLELPPPDRPRRLRRLLLSEKRIDRWYRTQKKTVPTMNTPRSTPTTAPMVTLDDWSGSRLRRCRWGAFTALKRLAIAS